MQHKYGKPVITEERTCKNDCQRYPCFMGIDNMKTNFSLVCFKFKQKERQCVDCKFYKTWNCSNPDAKEICEQYRLREKI